MRRLKLLLSVVFFAGYLTIQCALCLRSIASEARQEYGFGMYTSKSLEQPYRVVRSDDTRESFRMRRIKPTNELVLSSVETGTVLVYPSASKPEWSPWLACRAHSADAVAIEWTDNGIQQRFPCRR